MSNQSKKIKDESSNSERILAFNISEKFPLELLTSISGGSVKNGTKNACVEYTNRNGHSDSQADVNYDW